MANEILEVSIKLDTGEVKQGFIALEKDAKRAGTSAGENLGGGFSKGQASLVTLNAGLSVAKEVLNQIKEVAEKAFEFAKEGEEIEAISKRFEILGNQFGLVPEKISNGISAALDGTVDMDDALKKASESFIELGTNANRLPEIFELARKASQVFGGDTLARVDQLSAAIASGSTRRLKDIGLVIDSSRVYAEYASKLGVTADFLNETQKQQAILNAVLAKGAEKFKDINGSLTPLEENSKRVSVQFKELGETLAVAFNKAFGPSIKQSLAETAKGLGIFNDQLSSLFNGTALKTETQVELVEENIERLKRVSRFNRDEYTLAQGAIQELEAKLLRLKSLKNQEATSKANANSTSGSSADSSNAQAAKLDFTQTEAIRKLNLTAEQALAADLKGVFDARRANEVEFFSSTANVNEQYNLAKKAEELRYQEEIIALREQYRNIDSRNADLVNQLIVNKSIEHAEKIKAINKNLVDDTALSVGDFANAFSSGFDKIDKSNAAFAKQVHALGESVKQNLGQGFVQAFAAIGGAIAKGTNAFDAFGEAILHAVGQIAIQLGGFLILWGTGLGFIPGSQAFSAGAIAAGIALTVLGGVLSSIGSNSPSDSAPASIGGGIATTPGAASASLSTTQPVERGAQVSLTIQGDVLDSKETGLRIVDMLSNAFNTSGAAPTYAVST